jgi:hypothetical protein
MGHYRSFLFPDTHGALRAFDWPKAPRSCNLPHGPRANHLSPSPDGSTVSGVGAPARCPENPRKAGFFGGVALAVLHPIAGPDRPIRGLWRQRLALANRARPPRPAPRGRGGAARHLVSSRGGDDPGPEGACCKPGDRSPNATRWTKLFVWGCGRRTG